MAVREPSFLGVHPATIDAEGRIQLPTALRDEVNVRAPEFGFVATLDGSGSVCLRVREQFDAWVQALRARASVSQGDRRTLLTIAAHTAPVRCDKQGRVRVPDALLGLVGIDRTQKDAREVVLVGGFDEIHVWSPGGWAGWADGARTGLSEGLDRLVGDTAVSVPPGDGA